jgi:hypothetical protein
VIGDDFRPALKQKQANLKEMLDKGAIQKTDLMNTGMQKSLFSILNGITTGAVERH